MGDSEVRNRVEPEKGKEEVPKPMVVEDAIEATEGCAMPLQVVAISEGHNFELDEDALQKIFLKPEVVDTEVAIISVAGAFRKGKSFLLDLMLRYLRANCGDEWLGDVEAPLKGFSWRGGSERETTGIWIWSEPFILNIPVKEDGCDNEKKMKKLAVYLMDTQGTFDSESIMKDNVFVFGMSTMLSSTQVYNISQGIQEDDLQHLHLFTEYGKLVLSGKLDADADQKAFQRLVFLVRDWSHTRDYAHGAQGGTDYLNRILQMKPEQHEELKSVREHIQDCFENVEGFLMPHPGFDVTEDPDYDGKVSAIRPAFVEHLRNLVVSVLSPEHITAKKINGTSVTAGHMFEYFRAYYKIYVSTDMPQPKTILMATAEANNINARDEALMVYISMMEEATAEDRPYMSAQAFESFHCKCMQKALSQFYDAKKMGTREYSRRFEMDLMDRILARLPSFAEKNAGKAALSSYVTPLVLLSVAVISHLVDAIMTFFFLGPISGPVDLLFYVAVMTLLVWFGASTQSRLDWICVPIDRVTRVAYDSVLRPGFDLALQHGAKFALKEVSKLDPTKKAKKE
eukprot:Rmarinus@m.12542